jgi:peptidylprolyl isomerase
MVKGDKQPMWGSTTEEDMRGYAATTLPFQSFGALGMARTEFDDDSASSQFFWLLFDSDLTPAGKNLLDGAYACFGYTVEGADFLKDIKEGDIIVSASVIEGKEHLQ